MCKHIQTHTHTHTTTLAKQYAEHETTMSRENRIKKNVEIKNYVLYRTGQKTSKTQTRFVRKCNASPASGMIWIRRELYAEHDEVEAMDTMAST